ncbi:3-hydroxyisobutyrate dehydrogenase [Tamaricihabitans halophyticus]|uniref:3-hydroxyisobutyrate dehydrogenase n=1 Tax=Tamaricihabitans halophyticus TaxID=1262583 RepID=A0A4R2QTB3_9PSEU|nr:NAD(P)-dependent oxidoreductase [Tamaricihabitans halophyticus]TCP53172.1 3-hydroxyisobutyrate dehydrogenase [Tamaricihabitans halophyticus]
MHIACIGVGNMGGAVARRLAGAFPVTAYDPDPAAVRRCAEAGVRPADSALAAVAGADVVLTSLPTPELVLRTVTELVGAVGVGTPLVDISTIDPNTARGATEECAAAGVDFVACPLGKTPQHAEQGAIPLFVGGPAEAIERLTPVLARMGERVYQFGTVAAATTFKLVSNLIGMTNVAVLAEGHALAARAGIDPGVFAEALADTGAASFQQQVRLPWLLDGDWAARFGVDLAAKDVRLAVDAASRWGVPVPVGSAALAQLIAAAAHGYGDEDVIAIAKLCAPPNV